MSIQQLTFRQSQLYTELEPTAQSFGIVVSLAIAGAVFQNKAIGNIVPLLPDEDRTTLRSAVTGTDSTLLLSIAQPKRLKLIEGIVEALSSVYIVTIVAGAVVFLTACCMPVSKIPGIFLKSESLWGCLQVDQRNKLVGKHNQ